MYQIESDDLVVPSITLKNSAHKWIARSAFQKAVRRGRLEEALKCAGWLWSEGHNYFWKSMATIAIEDVGPAQPKVVGRVLHAFRNSDDSIRHDRVEVAKLIALMTLGLKSRLCCELCLVGDFGNKDRMMELSMAPAKILDYVTSSYNYVDVYCALALIYGKSIANKKKLGGLVTQTQALLCNNYWGLTDEELYFVNEALSNPFDTMCIAALPAVLITKAALKIGNTYYLDDTLPEEGVIKGVSTAAYDMHTSYGKKALKSLYTSLKKNNVIIEELSEEICVKALGALVFIEEGGLVYQRLRSPTLDDVRHEQNYWLAIEYGVPKAFYMQLRELVANNIPKLNEKRVWVMSLEGE